MKNWQILRVIIMLIALGSTIPAHRAAAKQDFRSRCLTGGMQPTNVIFACNEAIRRLPRDPELWNSRAVEREKLGNLDASIADLNTAIRLKPDYALGYVNRGRIRMKKADPATALLDLNEAIQLEPNKYPEGYYLRAVIQEKKGDIQKALIDYEKAAELDPTLENVRRAIKQARLLLGQPSRTNPNPDSSTSRCVSRELITGPEGIAACEEAIKESPGDANLWKALGDRHFDQGRYDLAVADFDEAVKLKPDNPAVYLALASAWEKRGDMRLAAEYLKMNKDFQRNADQAGPLTSKGRERTVPRTVSQEMPAHMADRTSFLELNDWPTWWLVPFLALAALGVGFAYGKINSKPALPRVTRPALPLLSPQEAAKNGLRNSIGTELSAIPAAYSYERAALKIEHVFFLVEALESLSRLREQKLISEMEFVKEKECVLNEKAISYRAGRPHFSELAPEIRTAT